jgi:hypothetical protein
MIWRNEGMREPTAMLPERISAAMALASVSYLFIAFQTSLAQHNCFVKNSSSAAMAMPAIFLCFVPEGKRRRVSAP